MLRRCREVVRCNRSDGSVSSIVCDIVHTMETVSMHLGLVGMELMVMGLPSL